jgi:SAM-dependent methyltransferase
MPTNASMAAELQRIYKQRFDAKVAYRNETWRILTRSFFQQFIPPQSTVLDVGCGYGEFINNIAAEKKFAMDLNHDASLHLATSIKFLEQDCSQPWPLEEGSLDAVFSSNFFEHLPDKATLGRTLAEAFRCLRPGGALIAMGPNIRLVPGKYWDFWDHTLPLSELSLGEGLQMVGFNVPIKTAAFLPYTMSGKIRYPLWMLRLYLSMPFAWRFFGHQFLIVGRKPIA